MAEEPKAEAAKLDPKTARAPKLRYQDRPEINEMFADSIRTCVFDGQLMRVEFTVARFDDPGVLGILEGRQVPVCRLVLNRTALADLLNRIGQLGPTLKSAGVISPPNPGPEREATDRRTVARIESGAHRGNCASNRLRVFDRQ